MIQKLKKHLDFKLIALLSAIYAALDVINFAKSAYFSPDGEYYPHMDWSTSIFNMFLDWIIVTLYIIIIVFTAKIMIQKRTKLIYTFLIHFFFSFFIGVFILLVEFIIQSLSKPNSFLEYSYSFEKCMHYYIEMIDFHFLVYLSFITIIYIYYYFQKIQENKIKTAKLQEQLSNSRLKFLQSQMYPHFLFNTLNSIHSLMDLDLNKSKSMIVDLSDILRDVLDKKDQNLIELQDELIILKKYINIKKTRFSDQLKFHMNIKEGLENILVPNMLIQPIVENSIKHGYDGEHISLEIFISIYKKNNKLIVKIENTGKKINEKLDTLIKKGTGLKNIKERLNTLYNDNYELNIYNKLNRVITKVSFPIQLSVSEIEKDY